MIENDDFLEEYDIHFACIAFPKCKTFPEGCLIENPLEMPDAVRVFLEGDKGGKDDEA
jgi:hypothetical protein